MTKKPIYNALAATIYIVLIVLFINSIDFIETGYSNENLQQFIMPIIMLSLLTLSVATMGYIFFYQPIILFLENNKKEAVKYFIQTILFFAIITILIFLIFPLIIIR
ncbi:MAG TPA: hypothetical protein P5083_01535 [Candidatus Paceibacterota bacterium]|jgi:uncharacterized membrane protein YidH (DUF202 family)|nr:hypothetical protein [Candidatus Paceibacterota bacterium]